MSDMSYVAHFTPADLQSCADSEGVQYGRARSAPSDVRTTVYQFDFDWPVPVRFVTAERFEILAHKVAPPPSHRLALALAAEASLKLALPENALSVAMAFQLSVVDEGLPTRMANVAMHIHYRQLDVHSPPVSIVIEYFRSTADAVLRSLGENFAGPPARPRPRADPSQLDLLTTPADHDTEEDAGAHCRGDYSRTRLPGGPVADRSVSGSAEESEQVALESPSEDEFKQSLRERLLRDLAGKSVAVSIGLAGEPPKRLDVSIPHAITDNSDARSDTVAGVLNALNLARRFLILDRLDSPGADKTAKIGFDLSSAPELLALALLAGGSRQLSLPVLFYPSTSVGGVGRYEVDGPRLPQALDEAAGRARRNFTVPKQLAALLSGSG